MPKGKGSFGVLTIGYAVVEVSDTGKDDLQVDEAEGTIVATGNEGRETLKADFEQVFELQGPAGGDHHDLPFVPSWPFVRTRLITCHSSPCRPDSPHRDA